MVPNLLHFLVVGALLLIAGILTMALKRDAIGILMGVELVLAAAGLNLVAFDTYLPSAGQMPRMDGQVFAFFIILLAAIQAAMALAIFVHLHRTTGSLDVDQQVRGEL
jgi:NADH-quinone oxidoreductase subunit K